MVLGLCIAAQLVLSSCGQENVRKTERPENEGVDTVTEITGFTEYSGKNREMFLEKGDKVAVISPSSTPSHEQTDAVLKGLKEWGYIPIEGKYTCVETRNLQDCIDDLIWALEDPEIKAVFCVRGGYASTEVLDNISNNLIRNSGKLIIGYSDITTFHSASIKAGIPSVHALMSGAFMDGPEECVEAQQHMMQGRIPNYRCEANEYCKEGNAKGILIGGNLSTFTACLGTEYDPTVMDQPYILFLEDVEEDLQHIHRYLTILKHMGVLDKAQAIVFGEWTDNPEDTADYNGDSRGGEFKSVTDMIDRQFAQDLDIPIAYGFPAGHGDINYPLLLGEEVELTVKDGKFSLDWK